MRSGLRPFEFPQKSVSGEVTLYPLFLATLPSRLRRPERAVHEVGSSESDVAGVLRVLSFGDLGLVVGIYKYKKQPENIHSLAVHLSNRKEENLGWRNRPES